MSIKPFFFPLCEHLGQGHQVSLEFAWIRLTECFPDLLFRAHLYLRIKCFYGYACWYFEKISLIGNCIQNMIKVGVIAFMFSSDIYVFHCFAPNCCCTYTYSKFFTQWAGDMICITCQKIKYFPIYVYQTNKDDM